MSTESPSAAVPARYPQSPQRRGFKNGLFARLAAFYLLLVISSAIFVGESGRSMLDSIEQVALQNQSWGLAKDLEPSLLNLTQVLPKPIVRQLYQSNFLMLKKYNPSIELYLLDKYGEVIQATAPRAVGTTVDLVPIRKFLAFKGYSPTAILGTVPGQKRPEVFSVCKTFRDGQEAYLYVILRNASIMNSRRVFGDYGLVFFASGASIAFLFFAVLVGGLWFRQITKRMSEMTAVLERFRSGDYTPRIMNPAADELGLHASAMNEMADKIEFSMQEIRLRDKLRRELIAGLSHDLRRPLAFSYSLAETLAEWERLDPERRQKYLNQLLDTQSNALALIDDLFELAKLEAKELVPAVEDLPLRALLESEIARQLSAAESRKQTITLDAPPDLPDVLADPRMIRRVVANLLENAVKHTPEGCAITVRALETRAGRVAVQVCDSGPGIPEDEVPLIFETFYRGRSVKGSGSGLGLSISRRLVEAHGADLTVRPGEIRGAVFEFTLDAAIEEGAGAQPALHAS